MAGTRDLPRPAVRLMAALVTIDALLILTFLGWTLWDPTIQHAQLHRLMNYTRDHSIPEAFNYAKWLALGVALTVGWRRSGWAMLGSLALVYAIVLADDALELHEKLGSTLVARLGLPAVGPLRAQDLGELATWAAMGVVVLGVLAWGFARGPTPARRVGWRVLLLLGALVACAIGMDMIHATLDQHSIAAAAASLLEDGGEMVVASVTLAYAVGVLRWLGAGQARAGAPGRPEGAAA